MALDTLEPTVADEVASTNGQVRDFALMIARAKAIMSGRLRPAPLETPPEIHDILRREILWRQPPPTPEAVQFQVDSMNLDYHHADDGIVVCWKTADGVLAVLAAGEDECVALFRALTPDENARILVRYPGLRL